MVYDEKHDYVWVVLKNSERLFPEAGRVPGASDRAVQMTRFEADDLNARAWDLGVGGVCKWVRKDIVDAIRTGDIDKIMDEIGQIAVRNWEEDERLGE